MLFCFAMEWPKPICFMRGCDFAQTRSRAVYRKRNGFWRFPARRFRVPPTFSDKRNGFWWVLLFCDGMAKTHWFYKGFWLGAEAAKRLLLKNVMGFEGCRRGVSELRSLLVKNVMGFEGFCDFHKHSLGMPKPIRFIRDSDMVKKWPGHFYW